MSERESLHQQIENLKEQLSQTKTEVIARNCARSIAILEKRLKELKNGL